MKPNNTGWLIEQHNQFIKEQLSDAQQSLFFAKSVREAKFLQSRIDYLKKQLRAERGKSDKKS